MANNGQQRGGIGRTLFSGVGEDVTRALEASGDQIVSKLDVIEKLFRSFDDRMAKIQDQGTPVWELIDPVQGWVAHTRIRSLGFYASPMAGSGAGGAFDIFVGSALRAAFSFADTFASASADPIWIPAEIIVDRGANVRYERQNVAVGVPSTGVRLWLKGWAE